MESVRQARAFCCCKATAGQVRAGLMILFDDDRFFVCPFVAFAFAFVFSFSFLSFPGVPERVRAGRERKVRGEFTIQRERVREER